MHRRGFLTGLGAALVTAPAIVRAVSLMPVKPMLWLGETWPNNDWYHMAVARSSNIMRLFIDNKEVPIDDFRFSKGMEIWEKSFIFPEFRSSPTDDITLSAWVKESEHGKYFDEVAFAQIEQKIDLRQPINIVNRAKVQNDSRSNSKF